MGSFLDMLAAIRLRMHRVILLRQLRGRVNRGFYELLKNCFDRFTDYILEENESIAFLNDNLCYSAISRDNKLVVGEGLTVKGKIAGCGK